MVQQHEKACNAECSDDFDLLGKCSYVAVKCSQLLTARQIM
jgi:hypothetical protein